MTHGETIEMSVPATDTFATIKDKLWQRKHYDSNPANFTFRVLEGEVFFSDAQRLGDFVRVEHVFQEVKKDRSASVVTSTPTPGASTPNPSWLDLLVIPLADVGDAQKRDSKLANLTGLPLQWGHLWKRGKGGAFMGSSHKWKRRFFLLQDITLFYYDSESDFRGGKEALDVIPMGSIYPQFMPDVSCQKLVYSFELDGTPFGKHKLMLCAESDGELQSWMRALHALNLRRVKSVLVALCEELMCRGLESEGLFRVSGNKDDVMQLKADYDMGRYPLLADVRDEHAIAGLVKLTVREMPDPLLTHALYAEFVKVGAGEKESQARIPKLREVLDRLPPANYHLVQYLMQFLKRVAAKSDKNMMTPANCYTHAHRETHRYKHICILHAHSP